MIKLFIIFMLIGISTPSFAKADLMIVCKSDIEEHCRGKESNLIECLGYVKLQNSCRQAYKISLVSDFKNICQNEIQLTCEDSPNLTSIKECLEEQENVNERCLMIVNHLIRNR